MAESIASRVAPGAGADLILGRRRLDARWAVWGVGAAVVGAVTLVTVVDPSQPGHYPLCPFYALTGYYCPGCGTMRAVHDLAHGDIAGGWAMNPLTMVMIPFFAWAWVRWALEVHGLRQRRNLLPAWPIITFGVIEVLFAVLRNVPAFAVLAPH